MKIAKLEEINKLYFTVDDLARALCITVSSAKVSASRYFSAGYILRIKRGAYVLKSRWNNLTEPEIFTLANMIQVPSYISLLTALSYYGVTTQLQQGYIESISLKRTKSTETGGIFFSYTRIGKKLYRGFSRKEGVFIASPEKAFLDVLYLSLLGKYSFDTASIDKRKLNADEIKRLVGFFPKKVKNEVKRWMSLKNMKPWK